ncbi:helix-turn-helix domain-containing protein [Streptomyces sp. NPDC046862]|uniref:helix-turn-helix domain-containing protein n=1 Tax=Streptomyces sp. NPDC046862 TaxID=3154603 RepID=UPI00345415EB
MAEKKPSRAVRPQPRVRRTTTRSGVTHIREHQPDRFTIIGNHLAQHRELSLTAIGLATHILSLPESASVDIRTLAARFPEGRDRIAFALRELEAHGYIERVRERTAEGQVITRTYAYNAPAITHAAGTAMADGHATPSLPDASADSDLTRPVSAVQPTLTAPAVPSPSAPPLSEQYDRAAALLVNLRRTDDRLTLPTRDVRRLASAVSEWFDNGATVTAVHHALTAALPSDLKNPAGLLAHRLRELLPPPLPAAPEPVRSPAASGTRARPHPFQTCDGCERAFRAPRPGRCRDCRVHHPPRAAAAA